MEAKNLPSGRTRQIIIITLYNNNNNNNNKNPAFLGAKYI